MAPYIPGFQRHKSLAAGCLGLAFLINTTGGVGCAQEVKAPAQAPPKLGVRPLPLTQVSPNPEAAKLPGLEAAEPKLATEEQSKLISEILSQVGKQQTQENIEHVFQLEREGTLLLKRGEEGKALIKFQDMYAACKELKYTEGEGRALDHMACIYLQKGQASRAKQLSENAVEVLSGTVDKKWLGKARVTCAQSYLGLDNPLWALKQLAAAMDDFMESGVSEPAEAANAMVLASRLAMKTNEPKEAVKFLRAAASYYGQAGDTVRNVTILGSVTGMLQELGYPVAAREEAERAVSAARAANIGPLLAVSLINLASAQHMLGEHVQARKSLEEVLSIKLDGQPPAGIAAAMEAYAFTLGGLGEYDKARVWLEKCYPAIEKSGAPLHKAQCLNALGVLDAMKGDSAKAIQRFRQAQDAESVIKPKRIRLGWIIGQNLAAAEARASENRHARMHYEGLIQHMRASKNQDARIAGQIYCALGEVCLSLKEVTQADHYLRQGITLSEKVCDDATLWRDYTLLAKLQTLLQQPAQESLTSAASYFRSPQAGNFPAVEYLTFPSSRGDLAQELVSLLVSNNMPEQALITAEQLKEEALIAAWQRRGADVKQDDSELYKDLVTERQHLHAAEEASSPERLTKRWQEWMRRFQLLTAENLSLARLIAPVPLNMPEIFRTVAENQVTVLDYSVGSKAAFVFVVTPSGQVVASKLNASKDVLSSQVAAFLTASQKNGEEARQAEKRILQSLHNNLIPEAVRKLLPRDSEQVVAFLPDSVLFNLPMSALIDAQGRFLVETHTIAAAPSLSTFMEGPPRFGSDQTIVVSTFGDRTDVRETQEAQEIANVFEPERFVKLLGKDAQLDNLKEQAKTNPTFHFTASLPLTEGWLNSVAEKPGSETDTKFSAGSLFKVSLPSDLAVLSGTSVNAKDTLGNGVRVLSRGLAYAGVRNVLMSLWINSDPLRTEQLVEFYKGRKLGLNQAQSLRKAQLLALSKDPSPRSWASFQLFGPGN